jgi:tetratricopeptide (TPR) repeat protein
LGYLPLALAQARAYMAQTGKTLAAYHRLFSESRPSVLKRERLAPDYPESIAKTWQVSVSAAAAECPASQPLLELLAFFAPDALPATVLAANPVVLPKALRTEMERDEATAALNRFSLIRAEAGSITVHRLVQAVTRDDLKERMANVRAEAAVRLVKAALPTPAWDYTNWPKMRTLLSHATAVAQTAQRLQVGLEAAGEVLNATALYHASHAAWNEAEPLFQKAITIGEKALPADHPTLATWYNNLASLYQAQGRLTEAEPLYRRALAILESKFGPSHSNTRTVAENLATLLKSSGRPDEADAVLKKINAGTR